MGAVLSVAYIADKYVTLSAMVMIGPSIWSKFSATNAASGPFSLRAHHRSFGRVRMWTSRNEHLANGRAIKISIDLDGSPVSYGEVLRRWQDDAEFRLFFIGLLADAPFSAFRWETPPITTATANRPFEFVLLDSPGLAREADADAFAEHFGGAAQDGVVEFSNLGKSCRVPATCSRHTAILRHLYARHRSRRSTHCGHWSVRRCSDGSAASLFG
jgi:hypothetical protein